MSLRLAIAQMDLAEVNVAEFCRDHQISRDRFYTIRRRYEAEGEAGLAPRSRAPNRVANRTSFEVEDRIIKLRKELDEEGLDAGAVTIKWHLDSAGVDAPTEATIWRILSRRGFIVPEPKKAPNKKWRRFVADFVNEMWQTDATHIELADGTEVDIVNILDDHSRVCIGSQAVDGSTTGSDAWDVFVRGVATYGIPAVLLSDNGAPFTSKLFTENLEALHVRTTNSRPYHPQTCGKVERFHQTLKKWLDARPTPETVADLQVLLDEFVEIYNTKRPHRGIGRRVPLDVFNTSPKIGPDTFSILDETTVHYNKVDRAGRVEIPGPYAITVGAAYTGKTATTVRTGTTAHVFIDNTLVRKLAINLNQRSQPLYQRSGRPT
ncbi:MAG: IS481 family transposase [Actinomycetota bacterium]|nr:IS481 family transposase [Actinomycetota bacterium]